MFFIQTKHFETDAKAIFFCEAIFHLMFNNELFNGVIKKIAHDNANYNPGD